MFSAPEEEREEDINTKRKEKKTRRSFQGRGSLGRSKKKNCTKRGAFRKERKGREYVHKNKQKGIGRNFPGEKVHG